jgi:PAS domain S-box-containing protein
MLVRGELVTRFAAYRHLVLLWGFILAFDAYVLNDLRVSRLEAQRHAVQLATSYVRLVEEHATASFDRTDLVLREVAVLVTPAELRGGLHLPASRVKVVQDGMADAQRGGPGIVSMTVTNAEGRVVVNSLGAPPGNSLADRDYFRTLRHNESSGPVVSRLIRGRVSNKWGIQVARSLTVDGHFAGMVVANMGLNEYFVPFYESLLLPEGTVVTLRDLSHQVAVRYPMVESALDQTVATEEVDKAFAVDQREGRYYRSSVIDGVARELVFRRIGNYPLYAVVGLAEGETLAAWRSSFSRGVAFVVLTAIGAVLATVIVHHKARLEMEVRDNSDKLRMALHAARAATWHWDAGKERLEWTGEIGKLYGKGGPPGTFEEWLDHLVPEDREATAAELERIRRERISDFRMDFRIALPGEQRWLAGIGSLVFAEDGRIAESIGVNIDITPLKLAQAELKAARDVALEAQAEAERASLARSKFLAAASHDLRQPVQSLLLLIEVMKLRLAGTPMEQVTVQMESALDGLRLLLNSLLDISKLDAGVIVPAVEEVPLGQMLDRLAGEYRIRAAEQGLDFRMVPTGVTLHTDAALLERLLRNLLENAIRYTPAGRVLLGCRLSKDWLRIQVVDTGIGIGPEHQEEVFEEFHQVHNAARDRAQGLGLGLAIVRRLAGLLGGRVELLSQPGKGSRFTLILPCR